MMARRPAVRGFVVLAAIALALAACGSGGSVPQLYVLGEPAPAATEIVSQAQAPVLEVRPVRVPDYLDTTDIVTRGSGGLVIASQEGRWGERLSVGLTRAVAARLASRLPGLAVRQSSPLRAPRWQVRIAVEALDVRPDGASTLAATWSLRDAEHDRILADERVELTEPATAGRAGADAAVVAAIGRTVSRLADRIAGSVEPAAGRFAGGLSP
jgi:uncharacterized lipoprotein YmbA